MGLRDKIPLPFKMSIAKQIEMRNRGLPNIRDIEEVIWQDCRENDGEVA